MARAAAGGRRSASCGQEAGARERGRRRAGRRSAATHSSHSTVCERGREGVSLGVAALVRASGRRRRGSVPRPRPWRTGARRSSASPTASAGSGCSVERKRGRSDIKLHGVAKPAFKACGESHQRVADPVVLAVEGVCGKDEDSFRKKRRAARRGSRLQSAPGKWSEEARKGGGEYECLSGGGSAVANQVAARTGRRLVLRVLRKGRRAFRRLVCEGLQSCLKATGAHREASQGTPGRQKKRTM